MKTSLIKLKRLSQGYDILDEDSCNIGVEEVFPRITNVDNCEDGIYEVITCDENRDWETNYIEDYNYNLIPFKG